MSKQGSNNASISQKLAQLNEYVAWFESDDFVLEQAIDKYNQAKKLADELMASLESFKNDVTMIKKQFEKDE